MLNSLSGRFLILTILFVMLAEVLIFVPSVARFRENYLLARLDRAQIASLALLADDMLSPEVEAELLKNAQVYNVVLRRDEIRQLALSSPIPRPVTATYDLRDPTGLTLMRDAMAQLVDPGDDIIRVLGNPTRDAGLLIEVTMDSEPLRRAMVDYGLRILLLSALISAVTATLLFVAVRMMMVNPIKNVVAYMKTYAAAPEDVRTIIHPTTRVRELREAELALQSLQTDLTGALRQKERLALLGGAVAKISHDLRNILATAQLFADGMAESEDPRVKRSAPKLVGSIRRAVHLCEATLAFGKAEEPPPELGRHPLAGIVDDVFENERLASDAGLVDFVNKVPATMVLRCDADQIFRVIANLTRNARQAIEATGAAGEVTVTAEETDADWTVTVADTGPGLPAKAREHLFSPFQGSFRKGGIGLGLVISAELVRGHGGKLDLLRSDGSGTAFRIRLPKGVSVLAQPAA